MRVKQHAHQSTPIPWHRRYYATIRLAIWQLAIIVLAASSQPVGVVVAIMLAIGLVTGAGTLIDRQYTGRGE